MSDKKLRAFILTDFEADTDNYAFVSWEKRSVKITRWIILNVYTSTYKCLHKKVHFLEMASKLDSIDFKLMWTYIGRLLSQEMYWQ